MRTKKKTCRGCQQRKPIVDFVKRTKLKDGYSNQCKLCEKDRKRSYRGATEPRDSIYWERIPTIRVLPHIERWLLENPSSLRNNSDSFPRAVHRLRNETQTVTFDHVDRLLAHMDLTHLWHVLAEHGGLADIYELDLRCEQNGSAKPPAARTAKPQHLAGRGSSSPAVVPSPSGHHRTPQRKVAA